MAFSRSAGTGVHPVPSYYYPTRGILSIFQKPGGQAFSPVVGDPVLRTMTDTDEWVTILYAQRSQGGFGESSRPLDELVKYFSSRMQTNKSPFSLRERQDFKETLGLAQVGSSSSASTCTAVFILAYNGPLCEYTFKVNVAAASGGKMSLGYKPSEFLATTITHRVKPQVDYGDTSLPVPIFDYGSSYGKMTDVRNNSYYGYSAPGSYDVTIRFPYVIRKLVRPYIGMPFDRNIEIEDFGAMTNDYPGMEYFVYAPGRSGLHTGRQGAKGFTSHYNGIGISTVSYPPPRLLAAATGPVRPLGYAQTGKPDVFGSHPRFADGISTGFQFALYKASAAQMTAFCESFSEQSASFGRVFFDEVAVAPQGIGDISNLIRMSNVTLRYFIIADDLHGYDFGDMEFHCELRTWLVAGNVRFGNLIFHRNNGAWANRSHRDPLDQIQHHESREYPNLLWSLYGTVNIGSMTCHGGFPRLYSVAATTRRADIRTVGNKLWIHCGDLTFSGDMSENDYGFLMLRHFVELGNITGLDTVQDVQGYGLGEKPGSLWKENTLGRDAVSVGNIGEIVNCTRMNAFAKGSSRLVSVGAITGADNLTTVGSAFQDCTALESFGGWSGATTALVSVSYAFSNCHKLKALPGLPAAAKPTNWDSFCQYAGDRVTPAPSWTMPASYDFTAAVNLNNAFKGTPLAALNAGQFAATPCVRFGDTFANCHLPAGEIEKLLVDLVAAGQSNGTLGLQGGTNAAKSTWTAPALAAEAALVGRGWTITSKP